MASESTKSLLLLVEVCGLSEPLSLVPEETSKLILDEAKLSGPLPSFFSPTVTLGIHASACMPERFDLPVPFVIVPPRRNVPVPAPVLFTRLKVEAKSGNSPCLGPGVELARTPARMPRPPIGADTICSVICGVENGAR